MPTSSWDRRAAPARSTLGTTTLRRVQYCTRSRSLRAAPFLVCATTRGRSSSETVVLVRPRALWLQGHAPQYCTMWLALTEATPLNGCMHILPADFDRAYAANDFMTDAHDDECCKTWVQVSSTYCPAPIAFCPRAWINSCGSARRYDHSQLYPPCLYSSSTCLGSAVAPRCDAAIVAAVAAVAVCTTPRRTYGRYPASPRSCSSGRVGRCTLVVRSPAEKTKPRFAIVKRPSVIFKNATTTFQQARDTHNMES